MFEKEAEEYRIHFENELYLFDNTDIFPNDIEIAYQKGAEFGYNKANEWHYVKDELPEKEKYVLIYTNVGNVYISRLVKDDYFINKKGGFVQTSAVIAWKEIVPPKEIE